MKLKSPENLVPSRAPSCAPSLFKKSSDFRTRQHKRREGRADSLADYLQACMRFRFGKQGSLFVAASIQPIGHGRELVRAPL